MLELAVVHTLVALAGATSGATAVDAMVAAAVDAMAGKENAGDSVAKISPLLSKSCLAQILSLLCSKDALSFSDAVEMSLSCFVPEGKGTRVSLLQ